MNKRNQRERVGKTTATRTAMMIFLVAVFAAAVGCTPTPKPYDPPDKTTWAPDGCRLVPSDSPVLGSPTEYFRALHADTMNSDELSIAFAPVFEYEWIAETDMYIAEGPTFDGDGNLYFSPVAPGEDVILVSLDPETGSRRWAVSGTGLYGGGAPLVLNDPLSPADQIIYNGGYDRAVAVQPDGTVLWDAATGLPAPPPPSDDLVSCHCFGLNYHVQADTLIGLTGDGSIYVLDRATGVQLLAAPYVVPGEPSPPRPTTSLPDNVVEKANDALRALLGAFPPESTPLGTLTDVLLGFDTKVANYFSVDAHTGRLWVVATAPDAEDGTVDGISEYGALYCLELLTAGGPPYTINELFHTSFEGGSGSTPTLNADGTRVYIGDNISNLIAMDTSDGSVIWQLDVGSQIFGSIGVASDNGEVYASTAEAVIKVIDQGTFGEEIWRTAADGYNPGAGQNFNLQLATVGANSLFVHSGAGLLVNDYPMPLKVGIGSLDRETGAVRYFADGPEESVSAISTGPDGSVYLGHSPLRRAVAWGMFGELGWTEPITGGVGKYAARRLDLLIRDAACAAAARALNAHSNEGICPASAETDIRQIQGLVDQCRRSSAKAIADGDLTPADWTTLDGYLTDAEASLALGTLDVAATSLQQACDFFPN